MKETVAEFRMELLEKLQVYSPVYTFIDRENFSVIDMAVNGNSGEAEAYRLILQKLPPIFEEEEKTADKISEYINKL